MMIEIVEVPDPGLGNMSYVVDLGDGSALVVDPERSPRPYLEAADRLGLRIRVAVETHLHADFVSGARELVALGAELIAPRDSRLTHPHRPVTDGDELPLGDLTLRVIATPGHTPEHVAYALLDGTAPLVVFTGGTLMAGGVARPDLIDPDLTVPLARDAFRSVRTLLDSLPETVELLPTHGGGSFCSSAPSGGRSATTVGEQRAVHPAVLATDPDTFADELLASLGTFPTYFRRLRPVNQRGPKVYGVDPPALRDLEAHDIDVLTVVDVRPIDRFAAGHIPGSISIELRDQFGTWLGWLVDSDTPVVFVVDPDQDERELVRQSLTIGHEALAGKIDLDAWTARGAALSTIQLLSPGDIPTEAVIVDVRQQSEWRQGHVEGATHMELGDLSSRPLALDAYSTVTHCGHGQRAMTAASLLRRAGNESVSATTGGPADIDALRNHR